MNNFTSRRRDILIGVVILIVIAAVFYLVKSNQNTMKVPEASTEPTITQIEQNFKDKYNITIPDDVEKTSLVDVSGGNGSGIATRNEVLVDLPDPELSTFYQAWLEKDGKLISIGKMAMEKGGWLVRYNGAAYPDYNKVIVSLEKVFDSKIEQKVLEGSF